MKKLSLTDELNCANFSCSPDTSEERKEPFSMRQMSLPPKVSDISNDLGLLMHLSSTYTHFNKLRRSGLLKEINVYVPSVTIEGFVRRNWKQLRALYAERQEMKERLGVLSGLPINEADRALWTERHERMRASLATLQQELDGLSSRLPPASKFKALGWSERPIDVPADIEKILMTIEAANFQPPSSALLPMREKSSGLPLAYFYVIPLVLLLLDVVSTALWAVMSLSIFPFRAFMLLYREGKQPVRLTTDEPWEAVCRSRGNHPNDGDRRISFIFRHWSSLRGLSETYRQLRGAFGEGGAAHLSLTERATWIERYQHFLADIRKIHQQYETHQCLLTA